MSPGFAMLKVELLELDQQLQAATSHTADQEAATSQLRQLLVLKQKLDDRFAAFDDRTWQLLLLEWRYDFALLFDHACSWIARVDANFKAGTAQKL